MASKFSLEAILSLTDNLTAPYKQTSNKITAINKGLTGSFGRLNSGIDKTIGFIGRGIKRGAQIGLGALAIGITAAAVSFVQLDDSIINAGAKFKDLDSTSITFNDSLKELSASARAVGKDTEFSAVDAAGALDKFAMAGIESSKAMVLLRGTTELATNAGTDLTTAVDILTDSLGAFGQMTDDPILLAQRMTTMQNQMSKTTTTANTSLVELFESIGKGARTFTDAGQSMATFNSFTGVMADATIKGGEAGTALRNVMLRLSKPSKEAAEALANMGVVTADANGDFRDIIDIIADFEKGLEGMGTQQRTAALGTIFGAKTVNGFNVLLGKGSEALRTYREDITNSDGASRTMAAAIRNSLGNRIKVLKSGLTELGLQFIDAFDKQGRKAIDGIIKAIANFDMNIIIDAVNKTIETFMNLGKFIVEHKGLIEGLVIAMTSFKLAVIAVNTVQAIQIGLMSTGPVLAMIKVFMSLAKTEGILATAQLALNTAMGAMGKTNLIILGITALIGLIILMVKHWDSVGPVLKNVGKAFLTLILSPINLVIDAIGGLLMIVSKIPGVGNKLKPALDALGSFQDKMNQATFATGFIGQTNAENQQPKLEPQRQIPSEVLQSIEREKAQQDRETKQRYYINLNAPAGYTMGEEGQTPTTSVALGGQ